MDDLSDWATWKGQRADGDQSRYIEFWGLIRGAPEVALEKCVFCRFLTAFQEAN